MHKKYGRIMRDAEIISKSNSWSTRVQYKVKGSTRKKQILAVGDIAMFCMIGHVVRMPLHRAAENMAALLRSVRLLKFSPSGLLQIARTKSNGPPLNWLYSRALGGSRTSVCTRQISPASENALRYMAPR